MSILFQTTRLIVRQLNLNDIDGFYDMQSNKKVMEMVPDKVMSLNQCKRDLKIRISNYNQLKKPFDVWAVTNSTTNEFIGTTALVYIDSNTVEIGYRFREQFWGKGIGTEVVKGLINNVFNNRKENKIVADVSKFNIGSTKILEKFMTKTGESYKNFDKCIDLHFELKK